MHHWDVSQADFEKAGWYILCSFLQDFQEAVSKNKMKIKRWAKEIPPICCSLWELWKCIWPLPYCSLRASQLIAPTGNIEHSISALSASENTMVFSHLPLRALMFLHPENSLELPLPMFYTAASTQYSHSMKISTACKSSINCAHSSSQQHLQVHIWRPATFSYSPTLQDHLGRIWWKHCSYLSHSIPWGFKVLGIPLQFSH